MANEAAPTELQMLKQRATVMGITYSNNIGVEALRAKINAKLNDEEEPNEDSENTDGDSEVGDSEGSGEETGSTGDNASDDTDGEGESDDEAETTDTSGSSPAPEVAKVEVAPVVP